MIPTVKAFGKRRRIFTVTQRLIKINASRNFCSCSYPIVYCISQFIPKRFISTPAIDWQKRSHIDSKPKLFCPRNIAFQTLNQFFRRRQITPWTERIYLDTYRMYNIIDTMLYYHGFCSRYFCLTRKANIPL